MYRNHASTAPSHCKVASPVSHAASENGATGATGAFRDHVCLRLGEESASDENGVFCLDQSARGGRYFRALVVVKSP